jgi:hypothetical protein
MFKTWPPGILETIAGCINTFGHLTRFRLTNSDIGPRINTELP